MSISHLCTTHLCNLSFTIRKDMSQSSHYFPGLESALRRANAEHVVVPFGVGICGHVAQTKEAVVLANAYDDPRFNPEVDAKTGYTTRWAHFKDQLRTVAFHSIASCHLGRWS